MFYIQLLYVTCILFFSMQPAEDTSVTSLRNQIMIGTLTGAAESVTRPLDFLKTMRMLKKPIPSNPFIWYAGLSTHLIGVVPTTIFQVITKKECDAHIDPHYACAVAGSASALVSCPIDRIILEKQTQLGKPVLDIFLSTIHPQGLQNIYRGLPAIAIKEIIYTLGYLHIVKKTENEISHRISNPLLTSISASIISGIPLGLMSHPFEAIRVRQQKNEGKTMWDVIQKMYYSDEGLMKTIFRGAGFRTTRYCISLFIMSNIYHASSKWYEKTNIIK